MNILFYLVLQQTGHHHAATALASSLSQSWKVFVHSIYLLRNDGSPGPWISLVKDVQLDRPRTETCMEYWHTCAAYFFGLLKHNSLPLGTIQPSSPSSSLELHAWTSVNDRRPLSVRSLVWILAPDIIYTFLLRYCVIAWKYVKRTKRGRGWTI